MKYSLKPTPGNLVVRPLPEEERTASGLWMVTSREQSSFVVEVIRVNPPPGDDPENYFKVGDHLIIGKWQGTDIKVGRGVDEERFMVINESSVLATLESHDDGKQQSGLILSS